jgi:uncharacterized membrane protein HdeD (DUF308 family)
MTLRGHTRRCLLVSAVALLVAGLAVLPDLAPALRIKVIAYTVICMAGGFAIAQWLGTRDPQRPSGDLSMDALAPGVAGMALMTLWTPVLLALAVVVLRMVPAHGTDPVRTTWELVVIGGMVGQHLYGVWSHRREG